MHRVVVVAAVLGLTSPFAAQSAAAQSYDSSFRFGLGLDYGGLAGRGDGGVGGLRLTAGARVHDHVAIYWQGQALGGAFVEPERVLGVFLGWNAVLAEANLGIFQVAAGPSFDVDVLCDIDTSQGGGLAGCGVRAAPGLATRAGVRFGIFALSGDLHVSFHETGPSVWVLAGIGIQLGDTAREPMRFPSTDSTPPLSEDAELAPTPAPRARARANTLGRRLDDPRDPLAPPSQVVPLRAPEPSSPERAVAPGVRRFAPTDVTTSPARSAPDARPPRALEPDVRDDLVPEASDDPIEGLEAL